MTGEWNWHITSLDGKILLRRGDGYDRQQDAITPGVAQLRSYFKSNPDCDGIALQIVRKVKV